MVDQLIGIGLDGLLHRHESFVIRACNGLSFGQFDEDQSTRRILVYAVEFCNRRSNLVRSTACIPHLRARPRAAPSTRRVYEWKFREDIETYRLVSSFKRAPIIATHFVNKAANRKSKNCKERIVLAAGYGECFVHKAHGPLGVTKKPFGIPGKNVRVKPVVGHGFVAKILFAKVLHNLHIELAGYSKIAKNKVRKPLHALRAGERCPATVPM